MMQLFFLKKVRVIISLIFFIVTLFVFVDFTGLVATRLIRAILYLQFIPSFLKFIGVFSLAGWRISIHINFDNALWKSLLFNNLSIRHLTRYFHLVI